MPLSAGVHFFSPTLILHVFQAKDPGPTAVVEAGIHGDEVAGVHAIQEMLEEGEFTPVRGRVVVIPVMNPAAYRARERAAPGGLDLNRQFPGDAAADEPEKRLARRFMDLVLDEKPDLLVTLHESKKRYDPAVNPSFGQTVVYGVDPMPPVVQAVVDHMNRTAAPEERWEAQYYPVATSSTEVIVDAVGCVGLCIETWMGFAERRRIEMQKEVVRELLRQFSLV